MVRTHQESDRFLALIVQIGSQKMRPLMFPNDSLSDFIVVLETASNQEEGP